LSYTSLPVKTLWSTENT